MHWVQGTRGAELHPAHDRSRIAKIFPKGIDPNGRESSSNDCRDAVAEMQVRGVIMIQSTDIAARRANEGPTFQL